MAASIHVTSSGTDVPNPTSTIPITSGGTFSLWATATEPLTKISPPTNNKINPASKDSINIFYSIFI